MSAHAEAHAAHPPEAHQSSRVDARTLGMFLFIASEVMLFGSFFTAYFFVRVAAGTPWPTPGHELPVFVAGVNTIILVTSSFTMHWGLQSIKRGNRAGLQAGLTLTFLLGLSFLLTQVLEYSRVGFAPYTDAFGTVCLGAASARLALNHHHSTAAVRSTKTASPAHSLITPAIAIAAK
jgi:cytochrome c oxidase subunit 3